MTRHLTWPVIRRASTILRLTTLVALVVGAVLLLGGARAWAAVGTTPCAHPPWAAVGPTTSCPPASPAPTAPASPAAPSTGDGSTPTTTGTAPTTANEEWGGEVAKGIAPLIDDVKKRFEAPPPMTDAFSSVYIIMFGFGTIIYLVMMMAQISRASKGGPRERAEFVESIPKFAFYFPVLGVAPGVLVWVFNTLAKPLAEGIAGQAQAAFVRFLNELARAFAGDPLVLFNAVGAAFLAFILGLGTVVMLVGWLILDKVAEFAVYLLAVALPIAGALALHPRWWRMAGRVIGVLIGVMLVPVVTRLGFWVMWLVSADKTGADGSFLDKLLTLLIVFGVATSTPMLLSYLMPALLPNGGTAYGGTGGSARPHGRQVLQAGGDAISRAVGAFRGTGAAAPLAARTATAGASAGGATAGGGGAAAAAGGMGVAAAAGGVLLAGAAAAVAAGNAVTSAAKSAAGTTLAASGGGMTADHETPVPAIPSRVGRGGAPSTGGGGAAPTARPAAGGAPGGGPRVAAGAAAAQRPAPAASAAPPPRASQAAVPMPIAPAGGGDGPGPDYGPAVASGPDRVEVPTPAPDPWQPMGGTSQWDGAPAHDEVRFIPPLDLAPRRPAPPAPPAPAPVVVTATTAPRFRWRKP